LVLRLDEYPACVRRCESESYLRLAFVQGDSRAQMRLGIALLCGLFGRFDFFESRRLFENASTSEGSWNHFAILLRDALSKSDCEIMNSTDFSARGDIFSFLHSSMDESIPLIRILNPHLCEHDLLENQAFEAWTNLARLSLEYLIDLSQFELIPLSESDQSNLFRQLPVLGSLPIDLLSCNSILEMIPLIFKMYSIECSLYKNVNHFLRCFPIQIISKFMKELAGLLHYTYLLQSSIEYYSHINPLVSNLKVYRGIQQQGKILVPLYESMIGEMIVWPGFTSTSLDRNLVISRFINDDDSLLFEISLHAGDSAVVMNDFSAYKDESEILIAASSSFIVEEVEFIDIHRENAIDSCESKITQVRLNYMLSWYDFNIDDPPPPIFV
jgi:hypothetical protein